MKLEILPAQAFILKRLAKLPKLNPSAVAPPEYERHLRMLKDQRIVQIGLRIVGLTPKKPGEDFYVQHYADAVRRESMNEKEIVGPPTPKTALMETDIPGYSVRRGKVRDIYEIDNNMLAIIATDRISAFDIVLPTGVPDKGKILTQLSVYWFDFLDYENHLIDDEVSGLPQEFLEQQDILRGRTMLVRKTEVIPVECVVRGYLSGSAWTQYQKTGMIGGAVMPKGLRQNMAFPQPMFTPTTKEEEGHDKPLIWGEFVSLVGKKTAKELRDTSIELYKQAALKAWLQGIIIADTKFEFGRLADGSSLLIDEVLTPDSSRFWPLDKYGMDLSISSYDKQFVRDWLTENWNGKEKDMPPLPIEIVEQTRNRYLDALEKLTGKGLC